MGTPNWAEIVQAVAAIVGLAGIAGALIYSGRQTQKLQRQIEIQINAEERVRLVNRARLDLDLMHMMTDLDRLFVDRAHLYPYFNYDQPLPDSEPQLGEVLSCAELILDYADMIARQHRLKQIEDEEIPSWVELLSTYYKESPAIRDQFGRFERGYEEGVRHLLGVDHYEAELQAGNRTVVSLHETPLTP